MSLDQIGSEEFARRNLWEATLFDENHNPLIWSTGLIKSTNIPKLSFTIEDILAGTSKGYAGWKLPDNLSIGIWETSNHTVEKYLDEWMTGKTGVFNPGTGAFRVQPNEDYLYRDVRVKTFIYTYTESTPYAVKRKQFVSEVSGYLEEAAGNITKRILENRAKPITAAVKNYIHAASEIAVSEMEKIMAGQYSSAIVHEKTAANDNPVKFIAQKTPMQKVVMVEKKQVIPVLDKITAAIGGLANQAVARIPAIESDITRRLIPPVVVPPLLMRVPVPTGSPFPQLSMIAGKWVQLQDRIVPVTASKVIQLHDQIKESSRAKNTVIFPAISAQKQEAVLQLIEGVREKAGSMLIDFASGESSYARQWKASEKTTSLVTYSTAIEGYDIGTYDYSTGDGVSYTVNLAVRDIKIEYPA
jgi:hypothetical protein